MELKDNWMFVKEAENAADAASKKGTAVVFRIHGMP